MKPPARAEGLLQDSWERARLGCVRGQVLVWTRGLNRRDFSKRKQKIEALSGYLENSPQQPWPLVPPLPQPLDCEHRISSPTTHLKPRSVHTLISGPVAWVQGPKALGWALTLITGQGAHI